MRKQLIFLLLAFLTWFSLNLMVSCAKKGNDDPPEPSLMEKILDREAKIKTWVHVCGITAAKRVGAWHDKEDAGCDTGDAALFNGLLCLSGDMTACEAVKKAQSSTGQWYRSEFYVDRDIGNSFSRDMAKGVLMYLTRTKDVDAADKWLKYIDKSGSKLCPDDSDGRCLIPPALWGLMKIVWQDIGLKPSNAMIFGNLGDDATLMASAKLTPLGFGLHLNAVDLHIRKYIGTNDTVNSIISNTLESRQPNNPYFAWHRYGNTPAVILNTLSKCPEVGPIWPNQWSWERDTEEKAWITSMGHECLFMFNLFQGK